MMRFKHLRPGMSLLEVIAAIGILALSGTSLFLMQQYLYNRMMIARTSVVARLRLQAELVQFRKNMIKEQLQGDGTLDKSLQPVAKDFTKPDMKILIKAQTNLFGKKENEVKNKEASEFDFESYENLYLITGQAQDDVRSYGALYQFIYLPKVVDHETR